MRVMQVLNSVFVMSLFVCFSWGRQAHAASDGLARRVQKSRTTIAQLTWKTDELSVETRRQGDQLTVFAILEGGYPRQEWGLLSHQHKIALSAQGRFRIAVPIHAATTPVSLSAVGIKGEVENEQIEVSFPTFETYLREQKAADKKRLRLTPGISFSSITYKDSRLQDAFGIDAYHEKAITGKLGVSYILAPPRLSFEGGGYFTLAALSKDLEITARFLGLNLRIGYLLPFVKDPWSLSLQVGLYYTSMFVTDDAFGFVNMAGPQVFPVLRRRFAGGDSIAIYSKLSPVTTATGGSLLSNRELAAGGAYTRALDGGHALSGTIDFSSYRLSLNDVEISTTTFSLGISYAL